VVIASRGFPSVVTNSGPLLPSAPAREQRVLGLVNVSVAP
jgi:hypothetical protein